MPRHVSLSRLAGSNASDPLCLCCRHDFFQSIFRIAHHAVQISTTHFFGVQNAQTGIQALSVMSCPVSVHRKFVQQAGLIHPRPPKQGVLRVGLAQAPFGNLVALLIAAFEPAQPAGIVQSLNTAGLAWLAAS